MLVGSRVGPFTIEKELGSGAMGTVYRAQFQKDDGPPVTVALKVVAMALLGNENALARFSREAEILKQLRHPHIVRLVAVARQKRQQGAPLIAMEYIDGESLDRIQARRGRFGWEEVVAYGKQLCLALQYAHEKGIVHRDLKPSNLMVTKDGTLKLTDFGIAKDSDLTALTGANSTLGTAAYMSPEQCRGERTLTNKSDLYSLGVVFFELLTGRKPFRAESTVDMFLQHVNEPPPRPGKLATEIPPKLETLILQLMAKNPDQRPTDAAWVGRMLAEVEDDAFARKSAGLDAAQARRVDRVPGRDVDLDDADREAARALKGSKKKRPKKPVEPDPWYTRKGVKAAGLVAALLAVGAGLFFAFKPPSQSALYAAVESASGDAKDAAVDRYLAAYGSRADDETEKVRELYREGRARKRDEVLIKRFGKGVSKPDEKDDPAAFDLAWKAMEAEKAGDLKRAAGLWGEVRARFADAANSRPPLSDDDLARAQWAWVADRRVRAVEQVGPLAERLRAQIQQDREKQAVRTYAVSDLEGAAVRAFRFENFGDRAAARRAWDTLAAHTDKAADTRPWFLLAAQRRGALGVETDEKATAERARLLERAIDNARRAAETPNPSAVAVRDARNGCRDVIDLYDGEATDAARSAVADARKLLDALSKL